MLATGALLGARYLLGPLLGRGGMADVYRADDLVSGRRVAVKVLRAQQAADVRRFATEAEVLGRLDHPAIVRLLATGDDRGVPYLVLELIDGQPLVQVLDRGPLSPDRTADMGAALASGLAHAHHMGVIHRDVKPGNVLFDHGGQPHLTDFGIARLVGGAALTTTGSVMGTACYLAPEQVEGREIGPAADMYALGLVLMEALSGQRPFGGSGSEAALARLQHDPVVPPQSPPWMSDVLAAMTAREPGRRPTADIVAEAFAARSSSVLGIATERVEAAPATAIATATEVLPVILPRSGAGRLVAAGISAIAVTAVLLLVLFNDDDRGPNPADAVTTTTTAVTTTTAAPPPPTTVKDDDKDKDGDGEGDNKGNGRGGGDD